MSALPTVACRGLSRYLGEGAGQVHVLRAVDLEPPPGALTAIVGPSGCGKSTLLYLLGLLDRADGGEILIGGEDLAAAGDARRTAVRNRHIGFVFQFHFLLAEFTALENVLLPMQRLGERSRPEMEFEAARLLTAVGLGDKLGRLPSQLSGGEQQRVAIARALANRPAIVLADEPTGNLDAANSRRVFDLLAELAHGHGQTIVVVTHNAELAARCDAVRRMLDGVFVA